MPRSNRHRPARGTWAESRDQQQQIDKHHQDGLNYLQQEEFLAAAQEIEAGWRLLCALNNPSLQVPSMSPDDWRRLYEGVVEEVASSARTLLANGSWDLADRDMNYAQTVWQQNQRYMTLPEPAWDDNEHRQKTTLQVESLCRSAYAAKQAGRFRRANAQMREARGVFRDNPGLNCIEPNFTEAEWAEIALNMNQYVIR